MKILIVEDHAKIALQLYHILKEILDGLPLPEPGFDFVKTEDEAVEKIGSENFNLITLDEKLEQGYGTGVLRRIEKNNFPKIIRISTDDTTLDFYKEKGVLTLAKEDAIYENLLPLVKKVLELKS